MEEDLIIILIWKYRERQRRIHRRNRRPTAMTSSPPPPPAPPVSDIYKGFIKVEIPFEKGSTVVLVKNSLFDVGLRKWIANEIL